MLHDSESIPHELDFMEALRQALNAPGRATRVWRQNVGTVIKRDRAGKVIGKFDAGPPNGAADLSGITRVFGWRLEVECKSPTAVHTQEQKDFGRLIEAFGGLYVLVRYDAQRNMAQNVVDAVAQIDCAIHDRAIQLREVG